MPAEGDHLRSAVHKGETMGENENAELKPDPANSRRRVSLPLVALTTALVVASGGGAYAIGTNANSGDDEPIPAAAVVTSSETSKPTESVGPSTSATSSSEVPPSTTPGLLTGVLAAPTTSASVTASPVAGNSSRSGSSSETNQYAPITSSYVRTTAVQTTTMPLPPEVEAALEEQESTTSTVPAPSGQGGALVGGVDKGQEGDDPVNPAEPRVVGQDFDAAAPAGEDQTDLPIAAPAAEPEPPVLEQSTAPEPEPAAPAPVVEPGSADELDASFRSAFAPGASDAQLAEAFESGPAMIPVGRALADGLPLLGRAIQWHLAGVVGTGDTATGQLVIATPLGTNVVPMTWVRHGEQWKIATESTCALGLALLGGCATA